VNLGELTPGGTLFEADDLVAADVNATADVQRHNPFPLSPSPSGCWRFPDGL
jgi:hypothetical protein